MAPHTATVYRHRAWHLIPPQYTDTEHDTSYRHSIQTQSMTPHTATVYRHRAWHLIPPQYTDTEHGTSYRHSIQTQSMTPHTATVYRHRAWHLIPPQYTDTEHDTSYRHSIQTQSMAPHTATVYRHRAWHLIPPQYTDTGPSLCYPLMWNDTVKYTATYFNVLGQNRPGNLSSTFNAHQRTLNYVMLIYFSLTTVQIWRVVLKRAARSPSTIKACWWWTCGAAMPTRRLTSRGHVTLEVTISPSPRSSQPLSWQCS